MSEKLSALQSQLSDFKEAMFGDRDDWIDYANYADEYIDALESELEAARIELVNRRRRRPPEKASKQHWIGYANGQETELASLRERLEALENCPWDDISVAIAWSSDRESCDRVNDWMDKHRPISTPPEQ